MKRALLALLVLVFAATAAEAQSPAKTQAAAKRKPTVGSVIGAAAREVSADLREAHALLKNVADEATRTRLELLITRSELKALEIQKVLAGAPAVPKPATAGISDEDFARLLQALRKESFDSGKADFVVTFAATGRLSSEQARELLKAFDFDQDRVRAAVTLYPRVTDPQKFFVALEAFTFDSGRSAVRQKLRLR